MSVHVAWRFGNGCGFRGHRFCFAFFRLGGGGFFAATLGVAFFGAAFLATVLVSVFFATAFGVAVAAAFATTFLVVTFFVRHFFCGDFCRFLGGCLFCYRWPETFFAAFFLAANAAFFSAAAALFLSDRGLFQQRGLFLFALPFFVSCGRFLTAAAY